MDMGELRDRGLVLLGCGKMGSAMLAGWLKGGLPAASVWVREPHPSDWLRAQGVHLDGPLPPRPAVVLVAVKPQMMAEALPALAAMGGGATLFVTVAAGTTITTYERVLGAATPVIRAMPNTPAAIGRGVTGAFASPGVEARQHALAEALLSAVGGVVWLDDESLIDAVTAVSGSGPAYVFLLAECMAEAGRAAGLPPGVAMALARATVEGAGELMRQSPQTSPAHLRANVTSPGGTTAAALAVLMADDGLQPLMTRAIAAAARRGRELAG